MKWTTEPMKNLQAYLPKNDIERLLNAAKNSKGYQRKRDYLLLCLLAYSGRRVGEILRIKEKDIIWEDNNINFNILKKKKGLRKIKPVNDFVMDLLAEFVIESRIEPEDYIFKSSWNPSKYITDVRVRQIMYKYNKIANIPDFAPGRHPHPHTLRHSFAVANAKRCESPADLRKLQQSLEHSQIEITTHYLQFSDEDQRKMVNNVYSD